MSASLVLFISKTSHLNGTGKHLHIRKETAPVAYVRVKLTSSQTYPKKPYRFSLPPNTMSAGIALPPLRPPYEYHQSPDNSIFYRETAAHWYRAYQHELNNRPVETVRVIQELRIQMNRMEQILMRIMSQMVYLWLKCPFTDMTDKN